MDTARFLACRAIRVDSPAGTVAVGPFTSTTKIGGPAPNGRVGTQPANVPRGPERKELSPVAAWAAFVLSGDWR